MQCVRVRMCVRPSSALVARESGAKVEQDVPWSESRPTHRTQVTSNMLFASDKRPRERLMNHPARRPSRTAAYLTVRALSFFSRCNSVTEYAI